MTETESARIFLNSKQRKTLSKIKQFTLEKLFKQFGNQFEVYQGFNYACTRLKQPSN
jgi:hypothetical protein